MRFLNILFIGLLFFAPTPAAYAEGTPTAAPVASFAAADSAYLSLVDAALVQPATADFSAIRYAYAKSSFYHPYGGEKVWQDLDTAATAARSDESLVPAYIALVRKHFGHFRSHVHAAHMYQTGGMNFAALAPHKEFLFSLVRSILNTGDGTSPETAFQIIDIKEEYFLMQSVLRVGKPVKQPLLQKDGHIYDVFDVMNPQTGAKQTIYFNVDRIFARPL